MSVWGPAPGLWEEFSQRLSVFTSQEVRIAAITKPNPCIVLVETEVAMGNKMGATGRIKSFFFPTFPFAPAKDEQAILALCPLIVPYGSEEE